MKAVIQRVKWASVSVDGKLINEIGKGLLAFVGFGKNDTENELDYIAGKLEGLRVFPDDEKESSLSLSDIGGEILLISQFTLYGDVKKGKRPSFSGALNPADARNFFDLLYNKMLNLGIPVKCGVFQAMMDVELLNDGPYTILLETET